MLKEKKQICFYFWKGTKVNVEKRKGALILKKSRGALMMKQR